MKPPVKKIAILGPESSGKTELCVALADYFNTAYVLEFARQYLPGLNRPYSPDDLLFITRMQLKMEDKAIAAANGILFCDTELINLKQWYLHKFGFYHPLIEELLLKKPYSFYLLTAPDLPWKADPLRENPGKGEYFFKVYREEIEHYGFPYAVVSGKNSERLQCAVKAVKEFLNRQENNNAGSFNF
jgi:NadR type nicotinamide-nucleotide adenylyltransferase